MAQENVSLATNDKLNTSKSLTEECDSVDISLNSNRTKLESDIRKFSVDWSLDELWVDSTDIGSATLRFCGISVKHPKLSFSISGASAAYKEDPILKASYELYERMALMEAIWKSDTFLWPLVDPNGGGKTGVRSQQGLFEKSSEPDVWQPAKSNGVAAGNSIKDACRSALYELIERHCVLASWFGAYRPRKIDQVIPPDLDGIRDVYRVEFYSFGGFTESNETGHISTTGVFLWPQANGTLLSYGFAADANVLSANLRALSEAVQRAGFFQGQTVNLDPTFMPNAEYHQEYFLHPDRQIDLINWLNGKYFDEDLVGRVFTSGNATFVDLTPGENFDGYVVKALVPETIPLIFGRRTPSQFYDCSESRIIHPIP